MTTTGARMMQTPADTTPPIVLAAASDGTLAWVDLDRGRIWPYVAGGDEGEPVTSAQPAPLNAEQQAMVDAAIGRARQEGRDAGANTARQEIESYLSAEAQAAAQADMDNLQRAESERDQARTAAETAAAEAAEARAAADRVTLDAFAMVALIGTGIPHDAITDALALLGHQPGDDEAALAGRAAALKERRPGLWHTIDATVIVPPPPPGHTPPKGPTGTGAAGESAYEAGQRLIRENPHLRVA